jgi:hypothetical protein
MHSILVSLAGTAIDVRAGTLTPGTTASADFEAAGTIVDEIQKVAVDNLSAKTYGFLLIPAAP